jgi:hypothetical protein
MAIPNEGGTMNFLRGAVSILLVNTVLMMLTLGYATAWSVI